MALTRPRASQIYDIDYKQATRVITVTNITLSGGAPSQVDGVNLSLNDRVLVTGQTNKAQNGIYLVDTVGSGSNGTWVRSSDTNTTGELLAGTIVMVTEGLIYHDTQWKLTTDDPIVIGISLLIFEQNSAFAFGNVYANGTAVLATSVGDVLTLSAGNNISISGNNASKTVTIGVTGISLNSISNGTSNVNVVSSGGNVTVGVAGTSNVAVFSSTGANITGTLGVTGNITGGNLSGTSIVGTLTTASQTNITSVGTLGSLTVTANVAGGNLTTAGQVVATGNVSGGNLNLTGNIVDTGALSLVTGGSGNISLAPNGTNTLIATTTGANVTGTLGVTGNITGGNLSGTSITGTLLTASQTNITSVGTLGSLTVTANVAGGNVTTAGQVVATGNISGGNILTGGQLISTRAGSSSTGAGQVYLNGVTNNRIDWNTEGVAAPAFTTRSAGTKLLMYPAISGSQVDYAMGINAATLWSSIPLNSPDFYFKWYGGQTEVASLSGAGAFSVAGNISTVGNISGGNILGNGAGLSGINTFKTVAVTGGNSAVADSIADTLTITAGSGIALVMDSTTDTLTIAASSGSDIFVDGADFGTVTEPVTVSDNLGLVTEAVTAEADLGALVVSGLIYPDQFVLPSYTANALPSASIAGAMIYVTNETGGAVPAFADGTNWRRVTDRAIVT